MIKQVELPSRIHGKTERRKSGFQKKEKLFRHYIRLRKQKLMKESWITRLFGR